MRLVQTSAERWRALASAPRWSVAGGWRWEGKYSFLPQHPLSSLQPLEVLVNLKEIKELLNLVVEKGISEFELERGGVRLRLKRGVNSAPPEASGATYDPPATSSAERALDSGQVSMRYAERVYLRDGPTPATLPESGHLLEEPKAEEREAAFTDNLHLVKSPIVGTFYEAPSPGAEPFVRVGDTVEVGQIICVIEAMKLMNEIEADVAGEVVKCYVSHAQPVEYGEILFAVRPKRKSKS